MDDIKKPIQGNADVPMESVAEGALVPCCVPEPLLTDKTFHAAPGPLPPRNLYLPNYLNSSNIQRTRLTYFELKCLTNAIRSLTDDVENHCDRAEKVSGSCASDNFAILANVCKQAQLVAGSALEDNDSSKAKELAEMFRFYKSAT